MTPSLSLLALCTLAEQASSGGATGRLGSLFAGRGPNRRCNFWGVAIRLDCTYLLACWLLALRWTLLEHVDAVIYVQTIATCCFERISCLFLRGLWRLYDSCLLSLISFAAIFVWFDALHWRTVGSCNTRNCFLERRCCSMGMTWSRTESCSRGSLTCTRLRGVRVDIDFGFVVVPWDSSHWRYLSALKQASLCFLVCCSVRGPLWGVRLWLLILRLFLGLGCGDSLPLSKHVEQSVCAVCDHWACVFDLWLGCGRNVWATLRSHLEWASHLRSRRLRYLGYDFLVDGLLSQILV